MNIAIETLINQLSRIEIHKEEMESRLQFDLKNLEETKNRILQTVQEIEELEKAIEKLKEEE